MPRTSPEIGSAPIRTPITWVARCVRWDSDWVRFGVDGCVRKHARACKRPRLVCQTAHALGYVQLLHKPAVRECAAASPSVRFFGDFCHILRVP